MPLPRRFENPVPPRPLLTRWRWRWWGIGVLWLGWAAQEARADLEAQAASRPIQIVGWQAWIGEKEEENFRRSLEIRGWVWQKKRSTPPSLFQRQGGVNVWIHKKSLHFRSRRSSRTFAIPADYRSLAVRIRSFLICLQLFVAEERAFSSSKPPPRRGKPPPEARGSTTKPTLRPSPTTRSAKPASLPSTQPSRRDLPETQPSTRPAPRDRQEPKASQPAASRPAERRPLEGKQPPPGLQGWWVASPPWSVAFEIGGLASGSSVEMSGGWGLGGGLRVVGKARRLALHFGFHVQTFVESQTVESLLLSSDLQVSLEILRSRFFLEVLGQVRLQSLRISQEGQGVWRHRLGLGGGLLLGWEFTPRVAVFFGPTILAFPHVYRFLWQGKLLLESPPWQIDLGIGLRITLF